MKSFTTRAPTLMPLMLVLLAPARAHADDPDYLAYTGCSEQTALLVLPVAAMPALPPGFAYTPPAGDLTLAAVHISGTSCDAVDGDGAAHDLLAFALVTPPAALVVPEVSYYALALGGYSDRPKTLAKFASWGITNLVQSATVDVELGALPLVRIGKVKATSATSSVTTQTTAVGTPQDFGAGHTRAYYVRGGVLVASFDAVYTPQTGLDAGGTTTQTGSGFLPAGVYPTVGSHAFNYDLSVGFVQSY